MILPWLAQSTILQELATSYHQIALTRKPLAACLITTCSYVADASAPLRVSEGWINRQLKSWFTPRKGPAQRR